MTQPTDPSSQSPARELLSYARKRARATPAWIRNVRYAFSAENIREVVTTLALVIPLTVLIWVWAEREQTAEYKPILTIDVHALNPSRSMSIVDQNGESKPVNVGVTLVGPKSGVDALRDVINNDAAHARITLEVPDDADPTGTHDVNVQPLLDEQKLFREYGVTVKSTEPNTVKVRSDDLVTRDVKVTIPPDFAGRIESIAADPATIRVRGPEALIAKLVAAGTLRADLDFQTLVARHGGEPGTSPPPTDLSIRAIDGIAFEPAVIKNVTAHFSQAETAVLRSVVVYVAQPAALKARATVTPLVLSSVKIAGPPDVVRQLEQQSVDARTFYAQIRIDRADQGMTALVRTPTIIGLPAGVRVDETSLASVRVDVAAAGDATDSTLAQ